MTGRTPLQVGIDLRPLPLQMQDGTVWSFNPDPGKEFFATVALIKEDKDDDDPTDPAYWDFIDQLREVLATQMTDDKERKEFLTRGYGLAALNSISKTYSDGVLGRPTQPSN